MEERIGRVTRTGKGEILQCPEETIGRGKGGCSGSEIGTLNASLPIKETSKKKLRGEIEKIGRY